MTFVGGWSQIMPATEEVQKICDQMRPQLPERYPIFKAITYQLQVVAGLNYCIKVETGVNCLGSLYIYVFRDLSDQLMLKDHVWRKLSELCEASTLPFPLDQIKQHAEDRTGKKYDIFRGINYKTERDEDAKYFIKVQVSECIKDHLILRVDYDRSPKSNPTLHNLLLDKTLQDPIEYFE
ncbi:cystatin-B [Esox lucius]|uniref:Cystatin domain-containing protein n=1 Tax=Esox lucius TaxID=8010 RepID=A0A3P8XT27_ESOLU|nr:cystatin-B [Esox lucius]